MPSSFSLQITQLCLRPRTICAVVLGNHTFPPRAHCHGTAWAPCWQMFPNLSPEGVVLQHRRRTTQVNQCSANNGADFTICCWGGGGDDVCLTPPLGFKGWALQRSLSPSSSPGLGRPFLPACISLFTIYSLETCTLSTIKSPSSIVYLARQCSACYSDPFP